jgi:hypothetical protein
MGKPEGNGPLEDLEVGDRIILKWTLRQIGWGGIDWIELVQDRDQ